MVTGLLAGSAPASTIGGGPTINATLNFCSLGDNGGENFFTPQSGPAPITFSYEDAANIDSASFGSEGQLTISDQVLSGACGWGMQFSLSDGAQFTSLSEVSDNFDPDISYDLSGGVITVSWIGLGEDPPAFDVVFDVGINGIDVPEPASALLFGAALAGLGVFRRRKKA